MWNIGLVENRSIFEGNRSMMVVIVRILLIFVEIAQNLNNFVNFVKIGRKLLKLVAFFIENRRNWSKLI